MAATDQPIPEVHAGEFVIDAMTMLADVATRSPVTLGGNSRPLIGSAKIRRALPRCCRPLRVLADAAGVNSVGGLAMQARRVTGAIGKRCDPDASPSVSLPLTPAPPMPWTNRVSAIVADLPTNCAETIERVALCRAGLNVAMCQFDPMPADSLGQAADNTSPVVEPVAPSSHAVAKKGAGR